MELDRTIAEAARRSGELGIRTLDLQADISELATRVTAQAETIDDVGSQTNGLVLDAENVSIAAQQSLGATTGAHGLLANSQVQIETAMGDVADLIGQVGRIHDSLGAFTVALEDVGRVTASIDAIANQTRLLALNATIEAARAGDAGRGFAVVASEVKKLASETATATSRINTSIGALTAQAEAMLARVELGVSKARATHDGTQDVKARVAEIRLLMESLEQTSGSVSERAASMVSAVGAVRTGLGRLAETSTDNARGLQRLSQRVTSVSDDTNELLQMLAESGADMPDRPYVRFAVEAARQVSDGLADAVRQGQLTEAAILGEAYTPVEGSDPPLFTHPAMALLTTLARPHQDAARRLPGFFGMSFTDRRCFGAVAMPERSLPQRPGDRVWNEEHSRAGLFFHFPDTAQQVKITKPFCLKAYRRPMADGGVVLLKQVIASIAVNGTHWGVLQLAYEDQA
ncbi:chemotaxis protein [Nostoc sp. 3335mG]|nr:chemotaxis protein [Nostoc sp. 3335mG]